MSAIIIHPNPPATISFDLFAALARRLWKIQRLKEDAWIDGDERKHARLVRRAETLKSAIFAGSLS